MLEANDFSIDIRQTLERILKQGSTAVTGVQGWMAQQKVRIAELEVTCVEQAQRFQERFRDLEQKNAELTQGAQEQSQRIQELEAARAMDTAFQSRRSGSSGVADT